MAVQLLDDETRITVADNELRDVTDGDADTTYTVRQIDPETNKRIVKSHTSTPINRRTGQREQVVDHEAALDDLIDHALVSWTGILLKGQPAPCTRENKLKLDYPRKAALLQVAGLNQVDRERSFRSTP